MSTPENSIEANLLRLSEQRLRTLVKLGVARHDGVWPGWRQNIDTATLDMSSANHSIVGQLYGWSDRALNKAFAVLGCHLHELGLNLPAISDEELRQIGPDLQVRRACVSRRYKLLTDIWKEEVALQDSN